MADSSGGFPNTTLDFSINGAQSLSLQNHLKSRHVDTGDEIYDNSFLHRPNVMEFYCKSCDKMFKSFPEFQDHRILHNKLSDKIQHKLSSRSRNELLVEQCTSDVFVDVMNNLLKDTQADSNVFVEDDDPASRKNLLCCSYCDFVAKSKGGLKLHKKVHQRSVNFVPSADQFSSQNADGVDNPFYCSFCKRYFGSVRSLKIHMGRMHATGRTSNNEECIYSNDVDLEIVDFGKRLAYLKRNLTTLRRCPKGARHDLAVALAEAIGQCVIKNDEHSWNNLLIFPYVTLRIPDRNENVKNVTSFVRGNIASWNRNHEDSIMQVMKCKRTNVFTKQSVKNIYKKVEAKLSDGDIRGALRLLSTEDVIAPNNETTLEALIQKHPAPPDDLQFPDSNVQVDYIIPTEEEVKKSIMSFPNGSAGGLDSLRPQILKDLLSIHNGDAATQLLSKITSLMTIILSGNVPVKICPYFFGASLTALQKKCGGIRPIASGNVWRRVAAKIACRRVIPVLLNIFKPHQLGVGIKNGAEAGAHAARIYYNLKHTSAKVFLKIDVKNAFNEARRDAILQVVKLTIPQIYKLVEQCYRNTTNVYYGEHIILSQSGVQQGDPLGPAVFCLIIQSVISKLNLDLNIWFLDDGTIAGDPVDVLSAFRLIISEFKSLGLELNYNKCEISVLGADSVAVENNILQMFTTVSDGIQVMQPCDEFLLGSPLTDEAAVICMNKKISDLENLTTKLEKISAHSAYYLLRISVTTPRLIFFLRGTPMWKNTYGLQRYDDSLKKSLEKILNINLSEQGWYESSLPIKSGGIGIRHASELALPCFLSSIYGVSDLLDQLLPVIYRLSDPAKEEAEEFWQSEFGLLPPEPARKIQNVWESNSIRQKISLVQNALVKPTDKARFLANSCHESGAWLYTIPSPPLGTFLHDEEFRIAVSLRLGLPILQPHTCVCGDKVDQYALHGLSCMNAAGTRPRHQSFNSIMQRALKSAEIPSTLEPVGCSRPDGKKPDGMSLEPWTWGKSLLWDYTCADSFASSYVKGTSKNSGYAAKQAENRKFRHYDFLADRFIFIPVATETSGVFGTLAMDLIRVIGGKIAEKTNEKRSTTYLIQRLAIAIQRGNVASIMGTIPPTKDLSEIFYL